MKLRLGLAAFALLLSATAFGHDANWWYEKYQKLGHTDPKWDALVREGIDHWQAADDVKTAAGSKDERALSVTALEKAYKAGCRCPIALFIDARNLSYLPATDVIPVFSRYEESLRLTENRPELTFVRILCANALARQYSSGREYKEAIPYFELALSLTSPEVEEDVSKQAQAGLQTAREKVAAKQEQSGRLAVVALPPNPTKEQVRAYVRQVLFVAGKKNSWGSNDPEIAMLAKVGPENLDVLLDAWGTGGQISLTADSYVKSAVLRLARDEHKPLLLKWLPLQEAIADIMQSKGWVQDMRPFLLERIAERSSYTNPNLLRAAAALRDPAAYGDLVWHFENNRNGPTIWDDISHLPGIQVKDVVLRMWAASKSWSGPDADRRYTVTAAAVDQGLMDALEFAVEKLDSPSVGKWHREHMRQTIRERTGLSGSDEEIRAWFKANKEKLVFDEKSRMFRPNP